MAVTTLAHKRVNPLKPPTVTLTVAGGAGHCRASLSETQAVSAGTLYYAQ